MLGFSTLTGSEVAHLGILVTLIGAVLLAIAHPQLGNAFSIGASKLAHRARGHVCKRR